MLITRLRLLAALLSLTPMGVRAFAQGGVVQQTTAVSGTTVRQIAELTASDEQKFIYFGTAVAVSGNTVVVAAPGIVSTGNIIPGAVYVYVRPSTGWGNMTQVAKLTASDNSSLDGFGYSVAISGSTIVVGSNLREVFVYEEPAGGWTNMAETAILTVSAIGLGPCLCGQVVVNSDTIAVGSPVDGLGSMGSVEVYNKPAGGWQNAADPDAVLYEPFGISNGRSFGVIAISDTGTIVGASQTFRNGTTQQVVEVFLKPAAGWNGNHGPQATLFSTRADANFGTFEGSVAILGNTVVAGSTSLYLTNVPPSFVDVWVKPFSGWISTTETAQLSDSSPSYQDGFGTSVAIAPIGILVGTPAAFKVGQNVGGAIYVFNKPVGGWQTTSTPSQTLMNSDRTANDGFGSNVAAKGSTIVVGAPFGPHFSLSGRAYIY